MYVYILCGHSAIEIYDEDVAIASGKGGDEYSENYNVGGHATSYLNGVMKTVSYLGGNDATNTSATCEYGGDGSISVSRWRG
jgi:hypothetical protein